MSAILSVRGLEKAFGSVIAARDITLDVPREQAVGIIGANGAGKTTFVNMITGYIRPSKGSIQFEDRDITGLPPRTITRLGISRSFQVAQVFPSLTVFENMRAASAVAHARDSILASALTTSRPIATRARRRCRRVYASSSTSLWQLSAPRACCCSTSRPAVFRLKKSSPSWIS